MKSEDWIILFGSIVTIAGYLGRPRSAGRVIPISEAMPTQGVIYVQAQYFGTGTVVAGIASKIIDATT